MSIQDVLTEFKNYYSKSLQKDFDAELREDKLRISSFPYCGLRHFANRLVQRSERLSFGLTYYTEVGKVTHSSVQRWLGNNRKMYGMWKCLKPKCKGFRILSRNPKCPRCGALMEYVEIPIRLPEHFKYLSMGLIDGLYRSEDGRYFIVDYKTTNARLVATNYKTKILPYKYNVNQVEAYCALIELAYNIEISGWILFYVARDNPIHSVLPTGGLVDRAKKKLIIKKIKSYDKQYGLVMNVKELTHVNALINEKPCQCEEDYLGEYADQGCSLYDVCFNEKKLKRRIKKMWDEKPVDWYDWRRPKFIDNGGLPWSR